MYADYQLPKFFFKRVRTEYVSILPDQWNDNNRNLL